MANEQRVRYNLMAGTIDDNPLTTTSTVITSDEFAALPAVTSTQHLAIVINPSGVASPGTNAEVVYITAHTAGVSTATVVRAREGSTARGFNSTALWVHGPTVADFSPNVVDTVGSLPASNGLPFTGQTAYILDTDKWVGYNGTSWSDLLATGGWTAFVPNFGGTGWAAGNATMSGQYIKIGRLVIANIYVAMGSSTTFGSGGLLIGNLPATAAGLYAVVEVNYYDSSAATNFPGHGVITPATTWITCMSEAVFAAPGNVFSAFITSTVPFTWAANDTLAATVIFEASA